MKPYPATSRGALIERLRVAMLGTTDGDFIDPECDIPAGEMFRLAVEWLDSVVMPLVQELDAAIKRAEAAEAALARVRALVDASRRTGRRLSALDVADALNNHGSER